MSFLRNYLLRSSEQLNYIRDVDSSEDRIFTLNTGKCPLMTLCSVETESRCNQLRLSTGNTLWEFVICVGTLESWACRRLEYPKSPGGLMRQNWSNWSNWRIDAANLIKLEQLGQQFKPKCRYVYTTSWMGLRWPVPSMSPRAPCECQNDQSNNWPFVITVFTHTPAPQGKLFYET